MKIFQITTFFHPVTGGVESHVYSLTNELLRLGHDVTVLCSDSNKSGPRLKSRETNHSGIKIKRFFNWFSLSYYHKFYPGLLFYLLSNDFDILHVHGFRKIETFFALFAGWVKKKPVVLTTHNPFPTSSRGKLNKFFVWLHDKTLGRWFTKKLSKIITIVPSEEALFIEQFNVPKDRIARIPNGLDQRFVQMGEKENIYKEYNIEKTKWKSIISTCCRLNYAKGLQNLKYAVDNMPDSLFIIAGGDDGYLGELKKIYFNNPNVFFTEKFLAPEKLVDIFAASDIFVLPSLHEAFGIVLLEAMVQGTPVVATNVGGPNEIITKEVGIVIDPLNQELWYHTLRNLLDHPNKLAKMRKAAIAYSKNFNWEILSKQIEDIYLNLSNKNNE
jgi:glycosyltransferase involved in cell wall biosynthesis